MRRGEWTTGLLLALCWVCPSEAAPPNPKAAEPAVAGDQLPPGQFAGILVSVPNSERMFTLKITYPEIRLKQGARLPAGGNIRPQVQNIAREMQQMHRLQQQMARNMHQHHAIHNMMQMQHAYMQMQLNQQRLAAQETQLMARIEQQEVRAELQLLRRQIQAIRNMYQVVQVSRNFDFQAAESVKVRLKDPPERFDDKGKAKKYSRQELSDLKGKDKNLPGYESTADSLKPGQTVLVVLRAYKKPAPNAVKKNVKNPDKIEDRETTIQHKMQVRTIVILREGQTPQKTQLQAKKK